MFQMNFSFFNVEIIRGFTSNFMAICSANSYPFGFPSRSKHPSLDILTFLVTTLINQGKKVAFMILYEDGALARSSEFMKRCHNMNIIVCNTGEDAYYLHGKSESPNNTLSNITRPLYWTQATRKKFGVFHISITYVSPVKLRIYFVVVFLTCYGMEQYLDKIYQNIGCEILHNQWMCYKKENWWQITPGLFNGICVHYRSSFILETRSTIYYS